MLINVNYDSSVNSAPVGFKQDIDAAVNFFERTFTTGITLTLNVGYGEIDGTALDAGALGESYGEHAQAQSYAAVSAALKSHGAYAANLPTSDPTNGGTFQITTAEAAALGLSSVTDDISGFVGFSSASGIFDYNTSQTPAAGQYDFLGAVEHEISEVMGRVVSTTATPGASDQTWTPLDLYRYTAQGAESGSETSSQVSYFSVDGGKTNLATFNNGTANGGDPGDWDSSVGNDSFLAFSNPGAFQPLSSVDQTVMQALGYSESAADYTITNTYDASGNLTGETIAMNAGGSVQVNYLASSTQVIVTGAKNGDTQTYSLEPDAQVVFGENTSISTNGADEIVIGGTGATINEGVGFDNLLIALGTGVQISEGRNDTDTFVLANNNATANVVGGTAGISSVWVASGETATISSLGNGENITLGGSDTVMLSGGQDTITSIGGSDHLTVGGANGYGATITGSNENITLATLGVVTVNGANETINAQASSENITLENTSGTAGTDTVSGTVSTIRIMDGTQTNLVSGEGNQIYFDESNGNVTISNTTGMSADILMGGTYTGDTVNVGQNAGVEIMSGGYTINVTGTGDFLNLISSGPETINASNTSITAFGGVTASIYGGGNTILDAETLLAGHRANTLNLYNTNGSADSFTGPGDTINMAANTQASISGESDTITAGPGATVNLSSTDGDSDTLTGSNDTIDLAGNVQVNVSGGGDTVSDSASGNTIAISNTNGSADTLDGSNDTMNLGSGTQVSIVGGGNTIAAAGTGSTVTVSGTNGSADTLTGSNDNMTLGAGVQAVIYGGGNNVTTPSFTVTTSASFLANQQELYRIYQAVLGRAPDADGFQYWVNQLQNGTSDASIVAGFMGSSEFQAKYGSLDNTGFVTALYQNVLGRQPDSSGLQYWVNALNNGLARPQLVLSFANSSEFESSSAAAVQAYITGSRFASLSAASTQQFGDIYRLYSAGLERAPDANGLYYWSHEIQNGTPESNIAQGFVNSSEFQQLYPTSESNTQFVTQLYQNILGRQPDSSGLQYWVNALNSGMSRAVLLTSLADSSEYQNDTAAAETEFMNGALFGYWQT